jgi:hypothetical protein
MSERMIELQRAKLGLLPAGPSTLLQNASVSPKASPHTHIAKHQQPTSQEAATAFMYAEDSQMERFINLLQKRDDSIHPSFPSTTTATTTSTTTATTTTTTVDGGDITTTTTTMEDFASHGPTVPTALSRRMLQRQGVGYLDNTVASVVSASADRFLATVLQQAVACRDQRLKGALLTKEASLRRKRHMQHYNDDTDDRIRRKEKIVEARETIAMVTINRAEALKRGGFATTVKEESPGDAKTAKKRSKKRDDNDDVNDEPINGTKIDLATRKLAEEEEEEYDSIDEEEEYYQEQVGNATGGRSMVGDMDDEDDDDDDDDDDEQEEDDTLQLRDIVRPLEAWNFHLTGKEAFESEGEDPDLESDDDNSDDEDMTVGQLQENGKDYDLGLAIGTDGNKSEDNKSDDQEMDGKKTTSGSAQS